MRNGCFRINQALEDDAGVAGIDLYSCKIFFISNSSDKTLLYFNSCCSQIKLKLIIITFPAKQRCLAQARRS